MDSSSDGPSTSRASGTLPQGETLLLFNERLRGKQGSSSASLTRSHDATATTSTGTGTSQANGDGDGAASATSAKEEADKASVAEETAGEGDDSSGKPRRRTRRD